MSKKIILIAAIAVVAVAAYFGHSKVNDRQLSDIRLANIEALATGEPGDQIPCWSSATRDVNYSYVDCASCERIEGWKGNKTEAYCTR